MPAQYEAIKRKYHGDKSKAARIFVGLGKSKYQRSQRAKELQEDRKPGKESRQDRQEDRKESRKPGRKYR